MAIGKAEIVVNGTGTADRGQGTGKTKDQRLKTVRTIHIRAIHAKAGKHESPQQKAETAKQILSAAKFISEVVKRNPQVALSLASDLQTLGILGPVAVTLFVLSGAGCQAQSPPGPTPIPCPDAISQVNEEFDSFNPSQWERANWANGDPFNNGWKPENITFKDGKMVITIDNNPSHGKPYSSGEYRSNNFYGYGTLEARIKPAKVSGTVSGSLFFYTGPTDNNPWDEIDIEFIGDPTKVQFNYIVNGTGGHEYTISSLRSSRKKYMTQGIHRKVLNLGFDASADFHTYGIKWEQNKITWFIDGREVYSVDSSRGPLPKTPGKIMMNAWPGTGVDGWLGKFNYTGPISAEYDWVKYTPYNGNSSCNP